MNCGEAHAVCGLADYRQGRFIFADSSGGGLPTWLGEILEIQLPQFEALTQYELPVRQQYQPATCGVWTVANACALAHGDQPGMPRNAAESHAFIEPWLEYVVHQMG